MLMAFDLLVSKTTISFFLPESCVFYQKLNINIFKQTFVFKQTFIMSKILPPKKWKQLHVNGGYSGWNKIKIKQK